MIDFDRFWAEPGAAPGMGPAETDAYLEQLGPWAQERGIPPEALIPDGLYPGPGVTDEQVAAWEGERGVRLPDVLREALRRQDGGYVRDSHVRVLPLARIGPPDADFWEWASYEEADVPDRRLVLRFAEEDEFSGTFCLNYNANGPQGEPSVLLHHSDPGDLRPHADSVTRFFTRMLKTTDAPKVDWSETESLEVVARETVDLGSYAGQTVYEQVLCRQGEALVFFTHTRGPKEETFTRTTLPGPLETEAFGASSIRAHRPGLTFGLHLQPKDSEGIVEVESKRTKGGRWKNSTMRGAPVYVLFESGSRGRLEALQRALFGETDADRARARDERQRQLERKLEALSPEERHAALAQMFLEMTEQVGRRPPRPEDVPPELAQTADLLERKMREVMQRAREEVAKHPVDPEISRLFGEITKPPADADPPGDQ